LPGAKGSSPDKPIKYAALGLSEGYFLNKPLAILRVHSNNQYTMKADYRKSAELHVLSSIWLRDRFPQYTKLANREMAHGLGLYWRLGGVPVQFRSSVQRYLGAICLFDKLKIYLRAFYHFNIWFRNVVIFLVSCLKKINPNERKRTL